MRRSPGAAPVGASDRKVSLPIGRCDGGARGPRGRASYLRFRHPRPFSKRRRPLAPSERALSLPLGATSFSLAPSHPRTASPAAATSPSLSLRALARSLSLFLGRSLSRAPPRLAATLAPASAVVGTAANTRYVGGRPPHGSLELPPLERTVAAPRRDEPFSCDALVTGCRSCVLARPIGPLNARVLTRHEPPCTHISLSFSLPCRHEAHRPLARSGAGAVWCWCYLVTRLVIFRHGAADSYDRAPSEQGQRRREGQRQGLTRRRREEGRTVARERQGQFRWRARERPLAPFSKVARERWRRPGHTVAGVEISGRFARLLRPENRLDAFRRSGDRA